MEFFNVFLPKIQTFHIVSKVTFLKIEIYFFQNFQDFLFSENIQRLKLRIFLKILLASTTQSR